MEISRLKILVKGKAIQGHRIALRDFITITENVQKSLNNIAQKIAQDQSKEDHQIKQEIHENCQLELINIFKGSLGIELGLKQQEVQPTIFPDIGEQALQWFLEGLIDLNREESNKINKLDEKTLKNVLEIGKVFKKGINEIEFNGQIRNERKSTKFTLETKQKIEAFLKKNETVAEQEIVGILWEADWKDHTAELYTSLGQKVLVKFDESFDSKIKEAARTRVKLKGEIKFEHEQPKVIKLKAIDFLEEKGAFKTSTITYVSEPSVQKSTQNPFDNAKQLNDLSVFEGLPDDWDVDEFIQTVYRMREEDRD